ncbi:hypothetical protein NWP96_07270 [Mycoplasmopsis cynos]|nr:hypothetical protein [Mycoplasmopsis cynos]
MNFRDYYNTRNNKLISKHNVFNQESKKKMAIEFINIVVNRKVLNVVVRYNGKNYAAFNLENKRVIFPFNSNVSLAHSSDNEIYFKYNGKNIFC